MARWFKEEEVRGLDPDLVYKLDVARGFAGVPFVITSGRRSVGENEAAGGVKDSAHLKGKAVDLACHDAVTKFRMVQGLFLAGFRRIGVYNFHVHADTDLSLPYPVLWTGESH